MDPNTAMQVEMSLPSEMKGPPLEQGPLPAVIYFALSAHESLNLDPFNQPLNTWIKNENLRVFSFTLPGHGPGQDKMKAMTYWSEHFAEVEEFIENVQYELTNLQKQGYINDQIGVAGLSRGAYISIKLASNDSRIKALCGFAPLIKLSLLEEFNTFLETQLDPYKIIGIPTRFYVGNNDSRVGTSNVYQFIENLTKLSLEKGIRSPQAELIIYPSIGSKGHGTPPEIFESGAAWLAEKIVGT